MFRKLIVVATSTAMIAILGNPAFAQRIVATALDAGALADACSDTFDPYEANFCTGYVLATFDNLSMENAICPPENVSIPQLVAMAKERLQDRSDRWHIHPAFFLKELFEEAFPCDQ